jgi:hypothetical protein
MAASVVIEMSGKEARLWRAQQKIISQQVKMEHGYRKTGQAARESGRAVKEGSRQAAGGMEKAMGTLATMAASYVGVTRVFSTIVGAAREAQEEVRAIAAGLAETYEGAKRLWQLSDSKERYEELDVKYKLAMVSEGIKEAPAQAMAFSAVSMEEEEALPQLAKTARYTDPEAMTTFIGQLRSRTAWGEDVATTEGALAGLALAAGKSKLNIEESADVLGQGASAWARMGSTPQETMAVMAGISPAFDSAEKEATGMRALEKSLSRWIGSAAGQRSADREGAQGILGTLQTWMRTDSKSYEEAMLGNVRFKRAAAALETPETQAFVADMEKQINEQFETGAMYYQKIGDRPNELTRQQAAEKARLQAELAQRPLAERQRELGTVTDQLTTVAAVAGRPLTVEKLYEKATEQGATFGQVDPAVEFQGQRLVDMIQKEFPETFRRHIVPAFPAREVQPQTFAGGPFGAVTTSIEPTPEEHRMREVPRELTKAQQKAMEAATYEVLRGQIVERAGVDPGIFPAVQGQQTLPAAGEGAAASTGLSYALPPWMMPQATPVSPLRDVGPAKEPRGTPRGFDPAGKVESLPAGAYQPDTAARAGVDKTPTAGRLGEDLQDVAESLRKPTPAPAITAEQIASPPQLPPSPVPAAQQAAAPEWGSQFGSTESRELGVAAENLERAAEKLDRAGQRAESRSIGLGGPDRDR